MTSSMAERMTGRQTLVYGSETIEFSLSFSPRKRLSITVEPNGSVIVKAPIDATVDAVLTQMRRRAGWIIRQRDRFAAFGPVMPPKRFVNGETHRYLGRQYRLRISRGDTASVKLVGRFFEITTPDKRSSSAVQKLLESWYRQHAQQFFETRLHHCLTSPSLRGLAVPSWSIRLMKCRWGSCTKEGRILLNLQLIQTSPSCIDYVITHELCHLIEHNHTAAFYHLLDRAMPDWRKRKKKLEMHEL